MLPAIVAGPPTEEELISAWPLSRRVPLREVFKSLGLAVPEVLDMPFGGAAEESFLAPDEDGDGCPSDAAEFSDTDLPAVPLSSDDEPLLAASASEIDKKSGCCCAFLSSSLQSSSKRRNINHKQRTQYTNTVPVTVKHGEPVASMTVAAHAGCLNIKSPA